MSDGIEIHFDEKRGYLKLACEPGAFEPYRDLAKSQLTDLPEIAIDRVVEINIFNTAAIVARREAPRNKVIGYTFTFVIVAVLTLAVIGLFSIAAFVTRTF